MIHLPGSVDPRPLAPHQRPFLSLTRSGGGENGGMSVYLREVARGLAARGLRSHIFTRRDTPAPLPISTCPTVCHLVHIDGGPPVHLGKNDVFYHLPEFLSGVAEYARTHGIEFNWSTATTGSAAGSAGAWPTCGGAMGPHRPHPGPRQGPRSARRRRPRVGPAPGR